MSGAAIIIPARFASTRLPGKPLLCETGKPLIQHTYECACAVSNASTVVIATDDPRIQAAVNGFGGQVVMTSSEHETGTARVAEAASQIDADVIINLQGDEPEIDPLHLERLIEIQKTSGAFASTLACRFPASARSGPGSPDDPAAVKVILNDEVVTPDCRTAKFFTRSISAYPRDEDGAILDPTVYFLHIGVYAFTKKSLTQFIAAPVGALEQSCRLEQLRILEMGQMIAVGLVDQSSPGIDTPEDYAAFVDREKVRQHG